MRILAVAGVLCFALIAGAGCAEEGETGFSPGAGAETDELDRELEELEREFESEPEPEDFEEEEFESEPEPATECHPSYEGACLDPGASDYDCEGGSGDGPLYTGTVTVVGSDEYGLDDDGDGIGCDP